MYDSCKSWSVDKPNTKIMGKVQLSGENSLPLSHVVKIKYVVIFNPLTPNFFYKEHKKNEKIDGIFKL